MTPTRVSSKYTTGLPIPRLAKNNGGYSRRICQNTDSNSQPSSHFARSTSNHMWWPNLTHRSSYITLMHWFLFLTILFFFFPSCFSHLYSFFCCYCVDVLFLLTVFCSFCRPPFPFVAIIVWVSYCFVPQPWPVLYPSLFLYYTFYIFLLSVSATLLHLTNKTNRDCARGVVYQTNMSNRSGCTGYLQC